MVVVMRRIATVPGFVLLADHVKKPLLEIGVAGKRVVQLCCNDGRELLSMRNMGAAYCLGVDQSQPFIERARALAALCAADKDVEFLLSDVYDIDPAHHADFDIVLSTVGVLRWLPDVAAYFAVAARLLKPGGHLVMEDIHPVLGMYTERREGAPSRLAHPYFHKCVEGTDGLDFLSGQVYPSVRYYRFQHTLADILMSGIAAGLTLRTVVELADDISVAYADLAEAKATPPFGFVMVWQK